MVNLVSLGAPVRSWLILPTLEKQSRSATMAAHKGFLGRGWLAGSLSPSSALLWLIPCERLPSMQLGQRLSFPLSRRHFNGGVPTYVAKAKLWSASRPELRVLQKGVALGFYCCPFCRHAQAISFRLWLSMIVMLARPAISRSSNLELGTLSCRATTLRRERMWKIIIMK